MICAYEDCVGIKEFEPKTHNQKYCSDECCRIATNKKLKEAYYEKKARLAGVKRICKSKDCNVILSRYNESKYCDRCAGATKAAERKALIEMIKSVSSKTGQTKSK
jgi:hypothetical protein